MATTRRVAKALLLDSNDMFLLLRRGEGHPKLAGFFDLPGGTIEQHEDFGEGLTREIYEETGLRMQRHELKVLYTMTKLINDKSYPTLLYYGRLQIDAPDVTLSYEHQSYEWAPLERLGDVEPQLAPTYREALEYVRRHRILEDINVI